MTGRFRSSHLPTLRQTCLDGFGIANLPAWLVDADIAAGRLVPVVPAWEGEAIAISAVLPPGRATPRRVRLFSTLFRDRLRRGGYGP